MRKLSALFLLTLTGCATVKYVNDPICEGTLYSPNYRNALKNGGGAIAFSRLAKQCFPVVAADGHLTSATLANDALKACRDASNADCDLYAVNGTVVDQKKVTSFSGLALTPDQRAAMMIMAMGIQNAANQAYGPKPSNGDCSSDFDCPSGQVCVKAAQEFAITGRCLIPLTNYGAPAITVTPSATVRNQPGCQFDTQCNMALGLHCVVPNGQLYGLCMKN
jgi:hypothetical protein